MLPVASATLAIGSITVPEWQLKHSDLKNYPHFDSVISREEAEALAKDPERVARHQFYPFMRYVQRWTRFAEKGKPGKPKERPIRYAARRDAYIFSYYRHILSKCYEAELRKLGIERCVLAYRRIPSEDGHGGKCNIHFARDAFNEIRKRGNCCVLTLDISSYFESLDHERLKSIWCRLLSFKKLPRDHHQVFKAVTNYSVVDKEKVYERLGHYGVKRKSKTGNPINGYLTPYNDIPKRLCSGKEFREFIAGRGKLKTIIERNFKLYGIPQGSPISDLLANAYLIEFDRLVHDWVAKLGGCYFRYSDDILVIVPGERSIGAEMMERVRNAIGGFGSQLVIQESKSALYLVKEKGADQTFERLHPPGSSNGIEYLGFRFDGRKVYLRDSTVSNLYRKIAMAARRSANACARRYPDRDLLGLKKLFPYERLIMRFGRVEEFGEKQVDYRKWTFWTYALRATKLFGSIGQPIVRQLSKHRQNIRRRANRELSQAIQRRAKLGV